MLANSNKKTLKVTGLHPSLAKQDVEKLFSQYFGLDEVQLKENFALVSYSTHRSALTAKTELNGFMVATDYCLDISFYLE